MDLDLIAAFGIVLIGLFLIAEVIAGSVRSKEPVFVINGFYMQMRETYTQASASLYYYVVEWDSSALSWKDFRGKVLGATDPAEAETGSLRRAVLDDWKKLNLTACPDVGNNGLHGSASPFEAMAERMNWIGQTFEKDTFAKAFTANNISKATLTEWTKDPQVQTGEGKASLFDTLEDMDSAKCIAKALKIGGSKSKGPSYTKNECFMFIKPHAVTDATKELVTKTLADNGITILKEGKIDGPTIDNEKLIDNHYYAIANKAVLTKPRDLNPPEAKQAEFESTFGLSWQKALLKGKVLNATDGCARLRLNGNQMDAQWAKAKKAKKLVKFGGGFYVGLVDPAD